MKSRLSQQRTVILEELRKSHSHPTADELYTIVRQRLPRISLGTLYRNLNLLAEQGEIARVEYTGEIRRFEGNLLPHQHAHCQKCGKVVDIIPPVPPPDTRHINLPGFTISAVHLEFDGMCHTCVAPYPAS